MSTFQNLLGVSTAISTPAASGALKAMAPADQGQGGTASTEAGFVSPTSLGNFAFMASAVNVIWQFLGQRSSTFQNGWWALAIAGVVGLAIFIANLKTQEGQTTPWPVQLIIAIVNVFILAAVAVGIKSQI